ncbi:hypothetical protein [Azospirillum sp. SYSU D00513]|uniref:hypothetical protein n=1 Tax=Azospirillum sp. SYSU D00513 TaxID=2812561 RepID=UPI001A957592|nr:hypothetical protein [Azospirillum sp. SYSU D00513]
MQLRRSMVLVGFLLAAGGLGGCAAGPVVGAAVAGAQVASLSSTKKTLDDHVASGILGEDCSTISLAETGRYCNERVKVDRSNLYCYRTLADVECHHIPDPYRNGNTALASPPPDRKTLPKAKGWFE